MKTMNKDDRSSAKLSGLPDDIAAVFAGVPPVTDAEVRELREAAARLDRDPEFVADFLKGLVVEDLLRALEEVGISKNALADRIGKTRQYVSRILDEDVRVNFTIDTLVALALALDRELMVRILPKSEPIVIRRARVRVEASKPFGSAPALPRLMTQPFESVQPGQFILEETIEPTSLPA